jgi:hypothetical protein
MATTRRRFNRTLSLEQRLASFAETARKVAALLPPGEEKIALIRKANQADVAAELDRSLRPCLQPQKPFPAKACVEKLTLNRPTEL